MLKYLIRAILKRSSRNTLFLVGLLALSSGLSTYVSANQNASLRVNATLDEHWRGAYDILVRPKDAVQPLEQQHGLVEANYLSVGKSGISLQQWKQIERLPEVEIAAPVATIGYLRNVAGTMLAVVPPQSEPYFYRFNTVISSTNGYRTSTLTNTNEYLLLDPSLIPKTITDTSGPDATLLATSSRSGSQASYSSDGEARSYISILPAPWTLVAGIDPEAEGKLTDLGETIVEGKYLEKNDGFTTERVPDPDQTDTEEGVVDRRRMIENGNNYSMNPDGPNIPVIFAASSYISVPVTVKIDELQMLSRAAIDKINLDSKAELLADYADDGLIGKNPTERVREHIEALHQPVARTVTNVTFDYGDVLKPLSVRTTNISLYDEEDPVQTEPDRRAYDLRGMEKAYRPGAISYEPHTAPFSTDGMLSLAAVPKLDSQTIITETGEVAFRSLPLAPPAMAPSPVARADNNFRSPFSFKEVGSYDLNNLPDHVRNPDPLTYVPLGIYQPPLVKLVRDADGEPLPNGPITLHPTLNPASFIPGPPLALTNIAAARFFRGDECIDAIRIRVAGIDRYTPENIAKVEKVAAEIIKTTGLHVDIVAGSSPQKVLVYVPGSPDGKVDPLGYVEEQWTTLGAAASITSGIDRASVLMLGATGLAGLLYLVSQSLLSTLARRKELALLQAVGWRWRHVSGLVIGEAALLGLMGGLCAVALAIVIASGLGLAAPLEQAASVGAVVFLLYLLGSVGPALWVVRQPIAELLQRGEVALPSSASARSSGRVRTRVTERILGGAGWWGLAGIAWRNLSRRRVRTLLSVGAVAIATTLLMLLTASLVALSGTLRVTLLGQFVGLQVQSYHFIMVGSALAISILTVADHLAVGVLERKHELALLQAVGWRAGAVRLSLLLEGVWLGLMGGLSGAALAIAVGITSRSELILSAWWVVPVCLVVVLALCSFSALYAISLTPRQALVRGIQQ